MRTVTVARMRELDRMAIEDLGIPAIVLMENAGAGAARALLARRPPSDLQGGVLVVAGRGNNGGDGYVVARHLHNQGVDVQIAEAGEPSTAEARTDREITRCLGIATVALTDPAAWPPADCVIDALLGVGFSGELRPDAQAAIQAMCERSRYPYVLALDVPSGLDADSGDPAPTTVRADLTCTFGAIKQGLVAPGAATWTGELVLVDISLPRACGDSLRGSSS